MMMIFLAQTRMSVLILASSLIILSFVQSAVDMFPWNGKNVIDHSEEILDGLRKRMTLDVLGEAPLQALKQADKEELYLNNLEGILFKASIVSADAAAKATNTALYDYDVLAQKLEGYCAIMTADYWNYEWCFKREITQFHVEQEGNKYVKHPNWSLGKIASTTILREENYETESKAPIAKVIEHYKGGQRCDENDQYRSVELHIQCCDDMNLPNVVPSNFYFANENQANLQIPKATLNSVFEPSVCNYNAIVCTPLLCSQQPKTFNPRSYNKQGNKAAHDKKAASNARSKSEYLKYVDFMSSVEGLCLVKQEEWWTYEVCLNKGVRQLRFNIEQSISPEGSIVQKQVLVNQYTLGNAPVFLFKNETALAEASSTTHALTSGLSASEEYLLNHTGLLSPILLSRKQEPAVLTLFYTNGTACDLDTVNRSTWLEVACGQGNRLVQIVEESTCQYRVKIELKLACLLPGFMPHKEQVTSVGYALAEDLEDEVADSQATAPATDSSTTSQKASEVERGKVVESTVRDYDAVGTKETNEDGIEQVRRAVDEEQGEEEVKNEEDDWGNDWDNEFAIRDLSSEASNDNTRRRHRIFPDAKKNSHDMTPSKKRSAKTALKEAIAFALEDALTEAEEMLEEMLVDGNGEVKVEVMYDETEDPALDEQALLEMVQELATRDTTVNVDDLGLEYDNGDDYTLDYDYYEDEEEQETGETTKTGNKKRTTIM